MQRSQPNIYNLAHVAVSLVTWGHSQASFTEFYLFLPPPIFFLCTVLIFNLTDLVMLKMHDPPFDVNIVFEWPLEEFGKKGLGK